MINYIKNGFGFGIVLGVSETNMLCILAWRTLDNDDGVVDPWWRRVKKWQGFYVNVQRWYRREIKTKTVISKPIFHVL